MQVDWGGRCVAVLFNGRLCPAKATDGCYCRYHHKHPNGENSWPNVWGR